VTLYHLESFHLSLKAPSLHSNKIEDSIPFEFLSLNHSPDLEVPLDEVNLTATNSNKNETLHD